MAAQIIGFDHERFVRVTLPRLEKVAADHVEEMRQLFVDRLLEHSCPICHRCLGCDCERT